MTVGTGPVCVRPFKDGESNGGATSRGVTAKTITIVAVTQNPAQTATQKQQGGTPPKNNSTGETGTMEDALHDIFAAYSHVVRDVGTHDRAEVRAVVGRRRSRPARRRAAGRGLQAVRGARDHSDRARRAHHQGRAGRIPRDVEHDHHRQGAQAAAVPLGSGRSGCGRGERGRVRRQATRREEGRVRGERGLQEDEPHDRRLYPPAVFDAEEVVRARRSRSRAERSHRTRSSSTRATARPSATRPPRRNRRPRSSPSSKTSASPPW